jgi:hypothetical protein
VFVAVAVAVGGGGTVFVGWTTVVGVGTTVVGARVAVGSGREVGEGDVHAHRNRAASSAWSQNDRQLLALPGVRHPPNGLVILTLDIAGPPFEVIQSIIKCANTPVRACMCLALAL